jgi:uncharacterized protein with NRDE domain
MCTIIFSYKAHPKYDFIFIGNRDEFKARPSKKAHYWKSDSNVLAGKDIEKGGTWTGITTEGRIAFVTNYRDFTLNQDDNNLSRGCLTSNFLTSSIDSKKYLRNIQSKKNIYSPFNLIIGSPEELYYYSNVEDKIKNLSSGIYGISNSLLDIPWYKAEKAKKQFTHYINKEFTIEELFNILDDTEIPADNYLPSTGIPLEKERLLSSIHIDSPEYGTLYKTIILVGRDGKVQFYEKYLNNDNTWSLHSFKFRLLR